MLILLIVGAIVAIAVFVLTYYLLFSSQEKGNNYSRGGDSSEPGGTYDNRGQGLDVD